MTIYLNFKSLIAVALLSGFSSFAAESAEDSKNLAPEVSAAHAKFSSRDIPDLKKAFIDATPTDRKDFIPVGELGVDGGNKAMILQFAQEIADNKHDRFDSIHEFRKP